MPTRTETRKRPAVGERFDRENVDMRIRAVDESARTAELSFSSETPVSRWWGPEILSHDAGCIDFSRMQEMGVVLFNHDRDEVLGRVISCTLDEKNKRALATVQFDDDEDADKIFRKVASGTLKGVSVGYTVDVWEEVATNAFSSNGRFPGPCEVATRWTPLEISIVSVPADASVGVGRSDASPDSSERDNPGGEEINRKGAETMPETVTKTGADETRTETSPAPAAPVAGVNVTAERAAAAEAERARTTEILGACRDFGLDPSEFIAGGASVDAVRTAILAKLAEERKAVPSAPRADVGEENVDKFREAGADALILRSGLDIRRASRQGEYKPADGAEELRALGLQGMMREYLQLRGRKGVTRMTVDELRREVFTPDSQFSALLDNTANKSMAIGYNDAGVTFDIWTKPGSNPDFKPTRRYQLSEAGTPGKILQNGEFEHDVMTDQRVEMTLETYGINWTLTRQAIINDDLSYVAQMPAAYVRGFRRLINRTVYGILNNNPTYSVDSVALFYSTHGNISGSNYYPTTASLGLARAAMRKQQNLRGDEYLNVAPKFAIAGPDLETALEILLISVADPDGDNAGVLNPFRGKLTLITDAEITSVTSSQPDWFLAADPRLIDTVEVAYLNGNPMPTLESQVSFEQLGMSWRLYGDFDVDVVDYRGLYKTTGAASS